MTPWKMKRDEEAEDEEEGDEEDEFEGENSALAGEYTANTAIKNIAKTQSIKYFTKILNKRRLKRPRRFRLHC